MPHNQEPELDRYLEDYRTAARQLTDDQFAHQWHDMGVPADHAAEWANAGFLPQEARGYIEDGHKPADVLAAEARTWPISSLSHYTAAMRHALEQTARTSAAELQARAALDQLDHTHQRQTTDEEHTDTHTRSRRHVDDLEDSHGR